MELIIDRKTWYRGHQGSRLLRHDGMKCCLGFYALACGMAEEKILNAASPFDVIGWRDPDGKTEGQWLFDGPIDNSSSCQVLMTVNDDANDEEYRERLIAERFAQHGVKVKFIG